MTDDTTADELTGNSFLGRITRYEDTCAAATLNKLPELGVKAPECYEALGMTLALLDCAASCYWGCAGGDHRLEFLIGRAANSAYSALLLATKGYYDQSLSIARTLGEMANLLALFAADKTKIEAWKTADDTTRKRVFKPVDIRLALEALKAPVPIDKHRYGRLSVFSIHAVPDAMPQAHNHHGQAVTFPVFQPAGFLLTLNEIAIPTAFIALYGSLILPLEKATAQTFRDVAVALIESVGGVSVMENGRPWFKLN